MKTVQDYLNDPRIVNAPDTAGALEPMREVHAIRLKIHDERKGMTPAEYNAIVHQRAAMFLASDKSRPSGEAVAR